MMFPYVTRHPPGNNYSQCLAMKPISLREEQLSLGHTDLVETLANHRLTTCSNP